MAGRALLYRQALTYDVTPDGALVPRALPAQIVPADREAALYRHVAVLADAPNEAIAEAATRYGPLGPTGRLAIGDPAVFVVALGQAIRGHVAGGADLGRWIANGGRTPIPGHLAPTAHLLCAVAETDPVVSQRLLELFTEVGPGLKSEEERDQLLRAMEVQEQELLAAIGRREQLLSDHVKKGDAHVRVIPMPGTGRYLRLAARVLPVLIAKADEIGPPSTLIPPESLGRLATGFQPYIGENILPPEHVDRWRQAAAEMVAWSATVKAAGSMSAVQLSTARELLAMRLRQVDAWPYPVGEQVGTFARALWSVWQRLIGHRPPRTCTWPQCSTMLPADAHGNRRHCDQHRRERDRVRAARNRRQRTG
jgi:hypothetical protein